MLKIYLSMAFVCHFRDNFVQLRKKCISPSCTDEILSVQIVIQSCFLSRLNLSRKYSSIKQGVHPPQHSTDSTTHMSELLRNTSTFWTLCERQKKRQGRERKTQEVKNKTNGNLNFTALRLRWCQITSDCGLSAEEVEGHSREERRDALLVMQMKGHHLSQSFGELGLHELHASIGALRAHTHKHTGVKRPYAILNNTTWVFHYIHLQRKTFKVKQDHLKLLLSIGDCQACVCVCVCVHASIHSRVKVSKSVWIN